MSRHYRVLFLSRSYPNNLFPEMGLWVRYLARYCSSSCELKVISPVPYCPPISGFSKYTRFRQIVSSSSEDSIETFHPRFLVGPGRSLYISEAISYYLGIRRTADKLHHNSAFDLIHAHFIYPDGVVAAWLGRRYKIPVVITEHAPWRPNWIDKQTLVRWQALKAARESACLIAVSRSVKDTIVYFTNQPEKVRVIPIGVDTSIFTPAKDSEKVRNNQILYVGFINFNKGIDLLLKAFCRVIKESPETKLVMVGGGFYNDTMKQEKRLCLMAKELGLDNYIEFTGIKSPIEVAKYMRESSLLVLPSRAESFGAVLVEALACGTPVVATRCGGPEDIVTDEAGILVQKENDLALAQAIKQVLTQQSIYDRNKIRAHALENFSWEKIARRTIDLYREILKK